jgi:stress response protein SCP2
MTILTPGANSSLPPGDVEVLIRHGEIPGVDIDVSAFIVTGKGKVRSDSDMCFYGQPVVEQGVLTLQGSVDGTTRFKVQPSKLPIQIEKVIFTATIHENKAVFGVLPSISVDISGVSGQIPCSGMSETALILTELYRRNGVWKVRVVGQGFNGGLAALATHLGVDIEQGSPTPTQAPPSLEPSQTRASISLEKGQTLSLEKPGQTKLARVFMGLGWDPVDSCVDDDIDLDASVIVFDNEGDHIESVSFFNLTSSDGAIVHEGDNLTGEGDGDDEVIQVDLSRIDRRVTHLVFTVTSYQGHTFDVVTNAFARLIDMATGLELCRYTLNEQGSNTAVIMVSLSKGSAGWVMKAHGTPCNGETVDDVIYNALRAIS